MQNNAANEVDTDLIKIIERRNDFRVTFCVPLDVKAVPFIINNQKVALNRYIHAHMVDLSVGGMKIRTVLEFPDKTPITFNLFFELMKEHFNIKGVLLRKRAKNGFFEYGIQFKEMIEIEKQRLVRYLNLYQIHKVKTENKEKTKK